MATLILSAAGTAVGGPIGGAVGALLGRAIDSSVIGAPPREGPRLSELAVTTSSYGQPIPRVFGTMRLPGSIIWATDLRESSETSGGKGQPKTTTYSYATSFAVALSSRPVAKIGRVWADGALLRGGAGDLKVGGSMRLHAGHGDAPLDPLIAADKGAQACAFRGLAYAVFEDLELATFGNRIPALSFEIVAGDGTLDLVDMLGDTQLSAGSTIPLAGLTGYADAGGTRAEMIGQMARIYPVTATSRGAELVLAPRAPAAPALLPPAIAGREADASRPGPVVRRRNDTTAGFGGLRYYDAARDYQPSLQRSPQVGTGGGEVIEFAGVLSATAALARIAETRRRMLTALETLSYRVAMPEPDVLPGRCMLRPGDPRLWLVRSCEAHSDGTDLLLERVVAQAAITPSADHGSAIPPNDILPGKLALHFFELPWDGSGAGHVPQRYVAVSQPGRRGTVALSGVDADMLVPLGLAAQSDAVIGESATALPGSPALVFEPQASVEIALPVANGTLQSVDASALSDGANRLLLGEEILQFRVAEPLGGDHWRLTGLLRGRGGTEHHAMAGHPVGTRAVLLDRRLVPVDVDTFAEVGADSAIANGETVFAMLASGGATLRPLAPVHPRYRTDTAGDPSWTWTRRARGAWRWLDSVEVPLVEEREAYRVGLGPVDAPVSQWDVAQPHFTLPAAQWAALLAAHPDARLWVRQVGSHAISMATRLPH